MRYTLNLISIFILTILIGVGFMIISADQVMAQGVSCDIEIVKEAIPADDTPFVFVDAEDGSEIFTLTDPSNPSDSFNLSGPEGVTITVLEQSPPGWGLADIECTPVFDNCGQGEFVPCLVVTEVENGLTFECLDNEEVTCTFRNAELARPIPTLSQWGLIAMAGILVLVGIWGITRKKAAT